MTLLAPWQFSILRSLGEDGISGTVGTPADGAVTVFLSVPFPCTISGFTAIVSAGTLTAAVQVNGVSVAGLGAVAVSVVEANAVPTQFTTTAQVAAGDTLSILVSGNAGSADFAYVVKYRRPNQP